MTTVVVLAALIALLALAELYETGVCVQCGGRGSHRDGCPQRRDG